MRMVIELDVEHQSDKRTRAGDPVIETGITSEALAPIYAAITGLDGVTILRIEVWAEPPSGERA